MRLGERCITDHLKTVETNKGIETLKVYHSMEGCRGENFLLATKSIEGQYWQTKDMKEEKNERAK